MIFLFPHEVSTVAQAVRAGRSVGVSGVAGIGLSALLDRLTTVLEQEGFLVIAFRGTPMLPRVELLTLQQAGIDFPNGNSRSVSALIDRLSQELMSSSLRAILLDDVESMDATSLGVIQVAAARTGTPIVHARHAGVDVLIHDGVRLTHYSPVQVVLNPLDFVSVSTLLESRLGAPADVEIVSRVYGRSGGVTGLALAIVDGARDAGILNRERAKWSMRGSTLWTPTVGAWLDARLSALRPEDCEALRHLALAHATPDQGLCSRLEEAQLTTLESRALLTIARHRQGARYSIFPPALGIDLRRTAGGARRLDLTQNPEPSGADVPDDCTDIAASVTHARDRLDERLLLEKAAWEQSGTVGSALPYLISLLQAPRTDRTVASVLESVDPATAASPEELFDLVFLREQWRACQNSYSLSSPGRFGTMLDRYPAWAEALETLTAALTADDSEERPPALAPEQDVLTAPSGPVIAAAHAYNCLALGRFEEAHEWSELIPATDLVTVNHFRGFTSALSDAETGETEQALATTAEEIGTAVETGDIGSVIRHSYSGALILLRAGRWRAALEIVERGLTFGPSGPINSPHYRALLHLAALVQLWLGRAKTARLFAEQAADVPSPERRLPVMQEGFGDVIERLLHDDPAGATAQVRTLASRLIARHDVFAASLSLLLVLVLHPEPATLELYASITRREGRPHPFLDIVSASFDRPERLHALVDELPIEHQDAALVALVLNTRASQEGQSERTNAITAASDALRARLGVYYPDERDNGKKQGPAIDPHVLSKREQEIARLARSNSNAAIAAALDLSVRTVESHIHNAFKKTGATSRQELAELVGELLC
ncbi:hypothetical protein O159_03190 [Leifsonia xyli subsp. cynodontis DSM 46306]|uniref:HTH luxR-type domain-containing protein n=1 Tax=Leifsonia xyli subsp. cynodontis DSM 46306 TaxID=1389489 RepID=U3P2J9_LEIXC|nr:LuxR C-terminal-related transcriptional regulator [Leifsonia xyli]AGW40540.1 hypothetical protein O159_03190 [Leifsonia xyli subsp. cynodontis DSM 46306]